MKPRQPYRSPFWRPDLADAPPAPSRREIKPIPAEPRTPPPGPPAQHPATPQRLVPYAPSDLALFGKLMSFGNGHDPAPAPQPPPAARPKRPEVAASPTSNTYTGRDAALFEGLEASFAGIAQPAPAARAAPARPSRGYTQADLDAFDKLTAFGR
jgi:hypothetical protein